MGGNRNPDVDAWFDRYDNPQKDLVQAVRQVVLDTDERVSEANPTGLLEGTGETGRVAKFVDADDLAAKADALRGLVRAWIDSKGG